MVFLQMMPQYSFSPECFFAIERAFHNNIAHNLANAAPVVMHIIWSHFQLNHINQTKNPINK